jgi:hypothetical protein
MLQLIIDLGLTVKYCVLIQSVPDGGDTLIPTHTYICLISWNRIFIYKLISLASKPVVIITVFTTARHLSLHGAISIQSTPSRPISLRPISVLYSYLRLGLPSGPIL